MSTKTISLTEDLPLPQYPFVHVLENRRSIREYGRGPIPLTTLSSFLALSSRNTSRPARLELPPVEVVQRSYPSGGSFHPLEAYPVLGPDAVQGCESGLYHYCPERHLLEELSTDRESITPFLETARLAAGLERHPPVVILITSKHGRMSYKYEGITYHLTLQEVGALYQTYYLVATLLDLAPCALGSCSGSEQLAQVADLDPLEEPLVGQFMLGPKRL